MQLFSVFLEKAKEYTDANLETFAYLQGVPDQKDEGPILVGGLLFPEQTCSNRTVGVWVRTTLINCTYHGLCPLTILFECMVAVRTRRLPGEQQASHKRSRIEYLPCGMDPRE